MRSSRYVSTTDAPPVYDNAPSPRTTRPIPPLMDILTNALFSPRDSSRTAMARGKKPRPTRHAPEQHG